MNERVSGGKSGAQPAFARPDGGASFGSDGMTLREYIATAALQGLLARENSLLLGAQSEAEVAVKVADALLEELAK